ncbi:MAG: phosphoglycerate dehydrogenase, partial [Rhizobiales bacterium]|nr:phosphoglycerate dehydrogenase [Hyphomicrobiales bacterium]
DLFRDAKSGKLSGPMVPYLEIEKRHRGKLELLPHAAADTEHVSRVQGAKQAVDQIFDCIRFKLATNLKGDLPEGYGNAGPMTVPCVGKVTRQELGRAAGDGESAALREAAETMAAIWGALAATTDSGRRSELIERYGAKLVKTSNTYATLMRKLGLEGPYA